MQSNVLGIKIELENTCKFEQVDKVEKIGKLDRSQTHVRITPKINIYLRKLQHQHSDYEEDALAQ